MKASNELVINSANPMVVRIDVDGSKSMADPISSFNGHQMSKAAAAALSVNGVLQTTSLISQDSSGNIKDRFLISVTCFSGDHVQPALPQPLDTKAFHPISAVANNPRRVEDGNPIWVEATAAGGTPMCQALDEGYLELSKLLDVQANARAAIYVLITDGQPTDGDPRSAAERIRNLKVADGHVTMFPIGLGSDGGEPVSFPASPDVLPESQYMREAARTEGFEVTEQSRAMVFNADASILFRALRAGTVVNVDVNR